MSKSACRTRSSVLHPNAHSLVAISSVSRHGCANLVASLHGCRHQPVAGPSIYPGWSRCCYAAELRRPPLRRTVQSANVSTRWEMRWSLVGMVGCGRPHDYDASSRAVSRPDRSPESWLRRGEPRADNEHTAERRAKKTKPPQQLLLYGVLLGHFCDESAPQMHFLGSGNYRTSLV